MSTIPAVERVTGTGDIDETIVIGESFRLVYVRVHFREEHGKTASVSPAELTISLVSTGGAQYDTTMYTFTRDSGRGIGADVNLAITNEELSSPSPWSFPAGTGIRFEWVNPGNVEWGIELGYDPIGV